MPTSTFVHLLTPILKGKNVDASMAGFERLSDVEIMNKAMELNENEEQSESSKDKVPARMSHETALQHIDCFNI